MASSSHREVTGMSSCVVDGCQKQARTKGLCWTHRSRMDKTGTTDPPIRKTLSDRFWERVILGEPTDACWGWGGSLVGGYGQITIGVVDGKRKQGKAHRVSWELHNGPIPAGMFVCHHCDNPPCTNPKHLFIGTNHEPRLRRPPVREACERRAKSEHG